MQVLAPPLAVSAHRPRNSQEVCLLVFGFAPLLTAREMQAALHLHCPKQSLAPSYPLRLVNGVAWAWLLKLKMFSHIPRLKLSCMALLLTGRVPATAHSSKTTACLVHGSWTGLGFCSTEVTHVRSLLPLAQNLIQLEEGCPSGRLLTFSVRFFFLGV